jgi:hypothetical protein
MMTMKSITNPVSISKTPTLALMALAVVFSTFATTGCGDVRDSSIPEHVQLLDNNLTTKGIQRPVMSKAATSEAMLPVPCIGTHECALTHSCQADSHCKGTLGSLPACAAAGCVEGQCAVVVDSSFECEGAFDTPPAGTICEISGKSGDNVACDIHVAKINDDLTSPTSLQLGLSYPDKLLKFVGFQDKICADNRCEPTQVPSAALYPSGHTAALTPANPAQWSGTGRVDFQPPTSNPLSAVTDGYYQNNGTLAGNTRVVQVVFEVRVPTELSAWVSIDKITAGGVLGFDIVGTIQNSVVMLRGAALATPCEPDFDPACGAESPELDPNSLCMIYGKAGSTVECPVRVARRAEHTDSATGLRFNVSYDETLLKLENFYGTVCDFSENCTEAPFGGESANPTQMGHIFELSPEFPTDWDGVVSAVIVHPTSDGETLNDAYFDQSGELIGDAVVATARFVLKSDIPASDAIAINVLDNDEDYIAASNDARDVLAVDVVDGVFVTSEVL